MIDSRFTDIKPYTANKAKYGSEPCLFIIIKQYYTSHGMIPSLAEKMTTKYIEAFTKIEAKTTSE